MATNADKVDLLIIGGGVLGAFHAYHAQRRGLSVRLLERHSAPRAASVRNFGQVVPSGLDSQWQPLGRESLQIYQSIQSEFDISVRQQGSIYIASDEEELALIEELHTINSDADYSSQLWTAQQCQSRYPQLRSDYCVGGLFFPDEVSVNPRTMIHRLHHYLSQQSNFQSHFDTCVNQIVTSSAGSVTVTTTDGGTFSAQKLLLCCGSEFQTLYPELFRSSDLKLVKLQMLRLKPQPESILPGNILTGLSIRRYESFSQCPSWAAIKARESQANFAQQWGIHLLFKQEADGGIILGDSHEYAPAAKRDNLNFDLRTDINQYFISEGQKIFQLPSWETQSSWFGIYCQTSHPAGIFTHNVGDNIHIATGIGGKGMTSSAGFAKHHLGEIYND
ncbi:TIGR03364 family FAD-dependent oxidoreductase [Stieleria sp. TO1_6]|uniref:TIGR03364 family FAD-dependent oxidoreductase n=1 Tax=Stieleria tagensis TaxID=2956795 RepID=UPI00209B9E01|nr:TIGR03364 family FAD-dependent oxidoreductase [Stieleria tagensis]MCO8124128.1 TIGR03364 family FAD-dependent oxidoreductase [Stieleria tagensis]